MRRERGPGHRADPLTAAVAIAATLFVLFSIGSPLYGGRVFHATQILQLASPWREQVPDDASIANQCVADTVDGVYPQRALTRDALRRGSLATLDASNAGGSDLASGLNAGFFNPVTFVPYLALPGSWAPAYAKVLELLVALLGMVLYLRRLTVSAPAAIVGGVVYAATGFMVAWTNWPQTTVAAFVPLLFWSLERVVSRPSVGSAMVVSLPVAAMLLGGFPAVTGWSLYAGAAYLLMRLWARRPRAQRLGRGIAAGVGGLALAAGVSAFRLVPFASSIHGADLSYRQDQATQRLPLEGLSTALFPRGLGDCHVTTAWFAAQNPIEAEVFVGTTALVLVLVALTGRLRPTVPRGVRAFAVLSALFILQQAYLGGPLATVVAKLPVFAGDQPGRLRFFLGFVAALLAALGLDRLLLAPRDRLWWRRPASVPAAGVWASAAVIAVATAYSVHRREFRHDLASQLDADTRRALIAAAVAVAAVLVAVTIPRLRRGAALVLAVLVCLQSYGFAHGFWAREPRSAFYPVTPAHAYLSAHQGTDRSVGDVDDLWPGTATTYGLSSPVGHSFTDPSWADLLQAADGGAFITATFSVLHITPAVLTSPVLDRLSVKYVDVDAGSAVPGGAATIGAVGGPVRIVDGRPLVVPAGNARVRAVGIRLSTTLVTTADHFATLRASILDSHGVEVGHGSRRLYGGVPAGLPFSVPVTEATSPGPYTVSVTLHARGSSALVEGDGHSPVLTLVTAADDGLHIVAADDSVIYRRDTSLPFVRWAAQTRVVSVAKQAGALTASMPSSTALVDRPVQADGRSAQVSRVARTATTVRAHVEAQGTGLAVIAEARLAGWRASLDGRAVPVIAADHGLQAVAVPTGTHDISLSYHEPGLTAGLALTGLSLLAYAVLIVIAVLAIRRGRDTDRDRL